MFYWRLPAIGCIGHGAIFGFHASRRAGWLAPSCRVRFQAVLRSVFGSFFPQVRVFNNFSASLSGLFRASYVVFSFVFSNFSGLFLQNNVFLSHNFNAKRRSAQCSERYAAFFDPFLSGFVPRAGNRSPIPDKTTILADKSQTNSRVEKAGVGRQQAGADLRFQQSAVRGLFC